MFGNMVVHDGCAFCRTSYLNLPHEGLAYVPHGGARVGRLEGRARAVGLWDAEVLEGQRARWSECRSETLLEGGREGVCVCVCVCKTGERDWERERGGD